MVDNRIGKIYIIKNDINEKVYIGQTIQKIERRFQKHLSDAKKIDSHLYRAINLYGAEHFFCELIEEVKIDELDDREIYWIAYFNSYKNGYNSTPGGQANKGCYNQELLQLIIDQWEQGKNQREIANYLQVDPTLVSNYINKYTNISKNDIKQRSFKNVFNYSDEELLKFWNQGLGIYQIKKQYGGNTIRKRLLELGVSNDEIENRTKEILKETCRKNQESIPKQKVYQYDLKGNFIKEYSSIKEASDETLIERSCISHCCLNDRKTAGNFIWTYTNNKEELEKKLSSLKETNKKKVFQYTKDNVYVAQYDSIAEAAREVGLKSYTSIADILDNPNRSAKGYRWYSKMI